MVEREQHQMVVRGRAPAIRLAGADMPSIIGLRGSSARP